MTNSYIGSSIGPISAYVVVPDEITRLVIPGEPVSKGRPRFNGKRAYTPAATKAAEQVIADAYKAQNGRFFEGQVALEVMFWNGNRRRRDKDNMLKLVMDALNGVAYADDVQVTVSAAGKAITTPDKARTEIAIYPVFMEDEINVNR